VKKLEIPRSD